MMGYMRHHAIVVTGSDFNESISSARKAAVRIFTEDLVSEIGPPVINGYASFFIAPDGSKEGWEDSNDGNDNRDKFLTWLESNCDQWLDWAEIQFGDDNHDQKMLRCSR